MAADTTKVKLPRDVVTELLGGTAASVVRLRCMDAMGWGALAAALGMSLTAARQSCDAAMDLMDALGPGRVLDGNGCATEPMALDG